MLAFKLDGAYCNKKFTGIIPHCSFDIAISCVLTYASASLPVKCVFLVDGAWYRNAINQIITGLLFLVNMVVGCHDRALEDITDKQLIIINILILLIIDIIIRWGGVMTKVN